MVSIIVPVYNVEKYITAALESVFGQTYQDIEVLIVDDCGNDRSMEIVSNLTQRLNGNENLWHENLRYENEEESFCGNIKIIRHVRN